MNRATLALRNGSIPVCRGSPTVTSLPEGRFSPQILVCAREPNPARGPGRT
jgi:hypothetical protein